MPDRLPHSANHFPRRSLIAGLGAAGMLCGRRAVGDAPSAVSGDAVIRGAAGASEIVITTRSRVAGGIHSVRWNGREFIDSHDHGRQLQSAVNLDVAGSFFNETFNPTEAGSASDGLGPTSSSRLLWLASSGRDLATVTQMAFWLRPDQQSGGHPARNLTTLSDHLVQKQVQIGTTGFDHAIRYAVRFTVPPGEAHTQATFEALTGYMPAEFHHFFTLSAAGRLEPLSDGPGEQPHPVVASTANGSHAMGIWTPDRCHTTGRPVGYGRFWFEPETVAKWNCVFRERAPAGQLLEPGTYQYLMWVAVGTREQVRATLDGLRAREIAGS